MDTFLPPYPPPDPPKLAPPDESLGSNTEPEVFTPE